MKTKLLILLGITIFSSSCTKIYLVINGIKDPKVETKESIVKKCNHYNKSYSSLLCIPADTASLRNLLKICKGFPRDIIFNRNGQLIIPEDTSFCAGKAMTFALKLDTNGEYKVNPKTTLSDIRKNVTVLGNKVSFEASDFDFTMVIFWANFLGVGNKNIFKIMEEMTAKSQLKLNFILVNMDIEKSWNMTFMPYENIKVKSKR
jgi:hypothetical protein